MMMVLCFGVVEGQNRGILDRFVINAYYPISYYLSTSSICVYFVVVVVVAYIILSRLLYLAFPTNLGLLCMPHPGMGSLV